MSLPATNCATDYAQRLRSIPPLPEVAEQIIRKMNDEFVDGNTVADIVAKDPSIAARLIGVANSAYFGLPEPVAEMRQVVNQVLGVDTVRSMAIALATQSLVKTEACSAFDSVRFWRHSLSAGTSAQRISFQMKDLSGTERSFSYLLGLCHNLGLLVLASLEPERLQEVFLAREDDARLDDLVQEEFGVSIADLTLALSRHWKLPETLVDSYAAVAANTGQSEGLPMLLRAAVNAATRRAENDDNADAVEVCELEAAGVLSDRERSTIDEAVRALGR